MPLFKRKKRDKSKKDGKSSEERHASRSYGVAGLSQNGDYDRAKFKYAPTLSKTQVDVGGLPVHVYGLNELSPASARASAARPPNVCVAIHMHGRGGSADNEEKIVRQIWDGVERHRRQQMTTAGGGAAAGPLEFLIVGFDARNHGHRLTNPLGQKGWKEDNRDHAFDLYSMIVGTAQDVSFLVDFLPSYLFPHDERTISRWAVTGKSLGGHAAWHVLANDPRITVGVPFISCPSYANLIAHRAPKSFVSDAPPFVPKSLKDLVNRVDPASRPYDAYDERLNPFWGKFICMCNGRQDPIVPWSCGQDFVNRLVLSPPERKNRHLRVVLLDGVRHEVTEDMIEEAAQWIYYHGVDVL